MADVEVGVRQDPEDDTWTGYCSGPGCGRSTGGGVVPFSTSGWPDRDTAAERIRQHAAEHATGEPMPELAGFLAERGLAASGDGKTVVAVPDDEKVT